MLRAKDRVLSCILQGRASFSLKLANVTTMHFASGLADTKKLI